MSTAQTTLCETDKPSFRISPSSQNLWQRYHSAAETRVEDALVQQYLPLVRSVLARLAMNLPEHADQDDLRSAGLLGLLKALRNYDPACGSSFEAYARTRIRGAMLDELRRIDWVPRAIHQKARKLQSRVADLEQAHGRAVSEEEIASDLGVTLDAYHELLDEIRPATFVCLDAACGDAGEGTYADLVADSLEESGPFQEACRSELKAIILNRLKELPLKQRQVLALYYGEDLHLREIAAAMGLTESRVCQIHAQAILSIRAYIERLEAMSTCPPTRS